MTAESCSVSATVPAERSVAIQNLRTSLSRFQQARHFAARSDNVVSTGISALDDILPNRGLTRGTLSEWIAANPGGGTLSLAMRAAGQAQCKGPLVIVDRQKHFYAPAFGAVGVCPEKTILVRPESRADELWAVEQSLRCSGIGAVICQIDHLKTQQFRRLQLAAESGTAIGLLIRPAAAQRQSGWADIRLLVSPHPSLQHSFRRRLEVQCVYIRGGLASQTVKLDVCDEKNTVRLVSGVSHSASALRTAGT